MARRPFDGQVIISQEYGTPNSFYRRGYHTGVDYKLSTGHKLVSPTNGTVVASGYEPSLSNGRGNYIVIQGDDGVSHHLYHMRDIAAVRSGRVNEGQHIGYVGSTGASTGPHLHWETRRSPHDGNSDFAPGTWLFAAQPVYVPAPTKEYVRIFGDYRTLYNAPAGSRKAVLAPRLWPGGKLDYEVLGRSGAFVKIRSDFFGEGWIYCGADVASLTQFYRA
jgi:hypothetical protein